MRSSVKQFYLFNHALSQSKVIATFRVIRQIVRMLIIIRSKKVVRKSYENPKL